MGASLLFVNAGRRGFAIVPEGLLSSGPISIR